jgi:hypothetical protein
VVAALGAADPMVLERGDDGPARGRRCGGEFALVLSVVWLWSRRGDKGGAQALLPEKVVYLQFINSIYCVYRNLHLSGPQQSRRSAECLQSKTTVQWSRGPGPLQRRIKVAGWVAPYRKLRRISGKILAPSSSY